MSTVDLIEAVEYSLSMTFIIDTNPDYWQDYTPLQSVKHALLRRYLGGWYAKLSWAGRLVYIDTHAGRGVYASGELGSPLVALDVLLNHKAKKQILKNAEVVFLFIEADKENEAALRQRIHSLGQLPARIKWQITCQNYITVIQQLIDTLHADKAVLAPAFVFVDPYTFMLPMHLLAELKAFPRSELFINFMWRHMDMAIMNPAHEENLNNMFGNSEWRRIRAIPESDQRCEAAIELFKGGIKAKYTTHMKLIGITRYVLIHATDHVEGRELMKDAMWAMCPSGGFEVRVGDQSN